MGKEVQHVRVGFFVFFSLAVLMFIIFMIGSERKMFETHYTLKGTFENISGLRIGAPVHLAGVNVGFVDDIRFPKDLMKRKIEVILEISTEYQERIRGDSVATINTQGLLGDKYIFIRVGSPDKEELKGGGEIATKEVVGLFELAERGGEILEDIGHAAEQLSAFFGTEGGGGNLKGLSASLQRILDEAEHGKGFMHSLVYDPRGTKILKDLSEITGKINRGEGTLGGLIADPTIYNEVRSFLGKANRNTLFKTVVRETLKANEKQVLK